MREMTLDRFMALLDAYGARAARWPDDERAAAAAFATTDPRAAALLAEADAIDARLFVHQVAAPSESLRAAVIAAAVQRRRWIRRVRLWWSGLAMAAAAGGGLLAGSAATAALEPANMLAQIYLQNDMAAYDDSSDGASQ